MDEKNSVKHDNDIRLCPACNSSKVIEIPENERMTGIGLYAVHDFIGQLYQDKKYKCDACGYRWGKY